MKSFRNEGAEQSEPALTDAGGPNSQLHTDIVLEDLLANSADALVVLDRDDRVIYRNHKRALCGCRSARRSLPISSKTEPLLFIGLRRTEQFSG
jgi:hypothetical protein